MTISRDSLFWWFSMIGAAALGITSHFDQFTWIPEHYRHVIEMIAFLYGMFAGKMGSSPLAGKHELEWRRETTNLSR